MVPRPVWFILGLGILTTITGCVVSPARYETPPPGIYGHYGAYQGAPYEPRIDYEKKMDSENGSFHKVSVLPSKTVEVIRALKGAPFIARAGNGIIYHQGSRVISEPERPNKLAQRLKEEFDPKHILPDLVL